LKKFIEYGDLDNSIFKELRILHLSKTSFQDSPKWKSLATRFGYLYDNRYDELKKELADFASIDFSNFETEHSVLRWKKTKRNEKWRFSQI